MFVYAKSDTSRLCICRIGYFVFMYMPYQMLRVYVYAVTDASCLCICRNGCFVFLYMLYRMLRVLMLCFLLPYQCLVCCLIFLEYLFLLTQLSAFITGFSFRMETVNEVPSPGSDSISRNPFFRRTISWIILSPKPWPSPFVE